MNVRKETATTFSIIVLIVGIYFLMPLIKDTFPYEVTCLFLGRFQTISYIGGYHSFILIHSAWLVVLVGIIDAVLKNKVALGILSSVKIPIILSLLMLMFVFIPSINTYMFWELAYITMLIGILWTFRSFIKINRPEGQKLIPFIKSIKFGAGTGNNHACDRFFVYGTSVILAIVYVLLIISFAVFTLTHWNMFV